MQRQARAALPLAAGSVDVVGYLVDGREQLAIVVGDVGGRDVLVRVHSECVTGDSFGSLRCDCGSQLADALAEVCRAGRGIVVYARGHEGRGIGLGNKLAAYRLQDAGADTVDANVALGLPVDDRDYTVSAEILRDLGVVSVKLLSNNPAKRRALEACGVRVSSMVIRPPARTPDNERYLDTKQRRMGHLRDGSS